MPETNRIVHPSLEHILGFVPTHGSHPGTNILTKLEFFIAPTITADLQNNLKFNNKKDLIPLIEGLTFDLVSVVIIGYLSSKNLVWLFAIINRNQISQLINPYSYVNVANLKR